MHAKPPLDHHASLAASAPVVTAAAATSSATPNDAQLKEASADTVYHTIVIISTLGVAVLVVNLCCYIAVIRKVRRRVGVERCSQRASICSIWM